MEAVARHRSKKHAAGDAVSRRAPSAIRAADCPWKSARCPSSAEGARSTSRPSGRRSRPICKGHSSGCGSPPAAPSHPSRSAFDLPCAMPFGWLAAASHGALHRGQSCPRSSVPDVRRESRPDGSGRRSLRHDHSDAEWIRRGAPHQGATRHSRPPEGARFAAYRASVDADHNRTGILGD